MVAMLASLQTLRECALSLLDATPQAVDQKWLFLGPAGLSEGFDTMIPNKVQ